MLKEIEEKLQRLEYLLNLGMELRVQQFQAWWFGVRFEFECWLAGAKTFGQRADVYERLYGPPFGSQSEAEIKLNTSLDLLEGVLADLKRDLLSDNPEIREAAEVRVNGLIQAIGSTGVTVEEFGRAFTLPKE